MLRKKVVGRVTMSLRQDIVVRAIGNPFAAFSIMALRVSKTPAVSIFTLAIKRGCRSELAYESYSPVDNRDYGTC